MLEEWDAGDSIEENSEKNTIDERYIKKLLLQVKQKHQQPQPLRAALELPTSSRVHAGSSCSAPSNMERFSKGPSMLKADQAIPRVNGDLSDDFDQCKYGAKTLTKIATLKIPNEVQVGAGPLSKDQEKTKEMIRRGKLHRKSRSVLNPASILKRKDTNSNSPAKKKVQFNTKKTVFRYNPHK